MEELSCLTLQAEISFDIIGGSPPYTVQWSDGQTTNPGIFTDPGPHTVTVVDASGCFSSLIFAIPETEEGCGYIKGHIVDDLNADCLYDVADMPLQNRMVRAVGQEEYFGITDTSGFYEIGVPPGDYTVEAINPAGLWSACQSPLNVSLPDIDDVAIADFPLQKNVDCPLMQVDIGTPLYRRCFDNVFYVDYCNYGTVTAEGATVEVTLPSIFHV